MSATYKTGVTVGKFSPPHLGHAHLISASAAKVENLYVLLCHKEGQVDATQRVRWLKDVTPENCHYIITPDDLPEAPEPWADRAQALINQSIDVAFTSEDYGNAWAKCMDCDHVCIDLERETVSISATAIRDNPIETFRYLVPSARAALCKRIVLVGAESSGKTTLAKALANALDTVWVPEYGRLYCDGRGLGAEWHATEFAHIASMQSQMIDAMARQAAKGALIVDTDSLLTRVWQRRYLPDSKLITPQSTADHYFICEPVTWEQDGTRESEEYRDSMLCDIVKVIELQKAPYSILSGDHATRLKQAVSEVHALTRNIKI